ncbi:hypothetical protein OF83DRAFT_1089842, partial [Amylostereum chailletii]
MSAVLPKSGATGKTIMKRESSPEKLIPSCPESDSPPPHGTAGYRPDPIMLAEDGFLDHESLDEDVMNALEDQMPPEDLPLLNPSGNVDEKWRKWLLLLLQAMIQASPTCLDHALANMATLTKLVDDHPDLL